MERPVVSVAGHAGAPPRSCGESPPRSALNARFSGRDAGDDPVPNPRRNAMAEEWHDADEVVEAQEGTEDEAVTRAAEHGKADAEGVLEQSGDASLEGTDEAAAWTPGRSTEGDR
jgi:hypothetical protein